MRTAPAVSGMADRRRTVAAMRVDWCNGTMTGDPARTDRERGALLRAALREATVPSERLRTDGLIRDIPELSALARTPQDPSWHPEGDVLVHSLWAADLAAEHAD